tara:strand:+ start:285 stop:497 length:213 start_codon:yes stop_codon:yes gene_type:complete
MKNKPLLTIERDNKYGGFDFGVNGSIMEMSSEEIKDFREMIIVAIGTMEDMWRREQERKAPMGSMEVKDD